uniref:EF-hand domain-containing protein n=1 Tax=Arcella intermedia TaxID=1963864 RepID=A0A6B2L6E2_9EUKA
MLAPVIVCNHISFMDGLFIFYVWNGSGISRSENGKMPVIGSLMHGTQSILIDRSSSESRKAGFNTIVKRAKLAYENPEFKQIELFPEGTTTNGTALVQFKVGAFAAGVPVQPIVLKYPNKYCDLTWPPNVSVGSTVLWMAVQFVNFMEAEFLPPYNPNEQEKADPQLYADNVRNYMAKASGLPTTEHSYDDCKLMFEASKLKLPENAVTSLQMEPINKIFNLSVEDAKLLLKEFAKYDNSREGKLTMNDFARLVNLPEDSQVVQDLFFNMDKDEDGLVSFKEYILGIAFWKAKTPAGLIKEAFDIFDTGHDGLISMDDVGLLLKNLFPKMTPADTEKFFGNLDKDSKGRISLEDFVACAQNHPHYVKIAQLMQKKQASQEEELL